MTEDDRLSPDPEERPGSGEAHVAPEDPLTGIIAEPEHLQPEQNFYHQYPFNRVFPLIARAYAEKSGAQIEGMEDDIAYMVSKSLAKLGNYTNASLSKIIEMWYDPTMLPPEERRERYLHDGKYDLFRGAVGRTFQILDKSFEKWREYVKAKRDPQFYDEFGKYTPRERDRGATAISLPQSYLVWREDVGATAQRIERGLIIDSLNTAFPQQAGTAPNRAAVMRTWQITRTRGLNS